MLFNPSEEKNSSLVYIKQLVKVEVNMTTNEIQCLSIKDTAEKLGISIPTLYKLLNIKGEKKNLYDVGGILKGDKKKIKSVQMGGRRVIQEAEILRFLSEGGKGDLYD